MQSFLKPHSPGTGGTSHELAGDVLGRGEKRCGEDFETIDFETICGDHRDHAGGCGMGGIRELRAGF